MKKEVTREQVIEAASPILERLGLVVYRQILAGEIADALGLEEPKPFERVMWASLEDNQSRTVCMYLTREMAQVPYPDATDYRYFPVLVTELSPDDPRVKA